MGLSWNVSYGSTTLIWEDNWVPSPKGFRVFSPKPTGCVLNRVCDLMDTRGRRWNVERIQSLFNHEEVQAIRQVPIVMQDDNDMLIWHCTKKGIYTVKSGYRVICENESFAEHRIGSASRNLPKREWNCLWNIIGPVKIKKKFVESKQKCLGHFREPVEKKSSGESHMSDLF